GKLGETELRLITKYLSLILIFLFRDWFVERSPANKGIWKLRLSINCYPSQRSVETNQVKFMAFTKLTLEFLKLWQEMTQQEF
ncbi:hypothetical protein PpSQ1_26825, partial [Pseudomonas putida]